jgi:class 3 adenylate cyclase
MPARSWPTTILLVIIGALRWAIILVVALFLLGPAVLDSLGTRRGSVATEFMYSGRAYVRTLAGPHIGSYVPTRFAGKDRTDWVLIAGLLVIFALLGSIKGRAQRRLSRRDLHRVTKQWKDEMHVPAKSRIAADLDAKIKSLQSGGTIDHQELLKIFAETRRKLDALARDLAFLSVDVVGSTQMKVSEEAAAIQHDFLAYRQLVEKVFDRHKVLKAAWTPDGVMACFANIDDAVQAGKDIITELVGFNASVKLMRTNFSVRCGVNAGRVYFDDSMPLETMSDRAIDVAGHMQKYAAPNTIAVSRTIVEPLSDVGGFAPTETVVDGYEVYSWRPGTS